MSSSETNTKLKNSDKKRKLHAIALSINSTYQHVLDCRDINLVKEIKKVVADNMDTNVFSWDKEVDPVEVYKHFSCGLRNKFTERARFNPNFDNSIREFEKSRRSHVNNKSKKREIDSNAASAIVDDDQPQISQNEDLIVSTEAQPNSVRRSERVRNSKRKCEEVIPITRAAFKKRLTAVDNENYFKVTRIVDEREDEGKTFFCVLWRGHDTTSWVSEDDLHACEDLIEQFRRRERYLSNENNNVKREPTELEYMGVFN